MAWRPRISVVGKLARLRLAIPSTEQKLYRLTILSHIAAVRKGAGPDPGAEQCKHIPADLRKCVRVEDPFIYGSTSTLK